jgi:hypothetical protein
MKNENKSRLAGQLGVSGFSSIVFALSNKNIAVSSDAHTASIIPRLLKYSAAPNWKDAKSEWRLDHIEWVDPEEAQTCECGHYPICEICIIENEVTKTVLEVGNKCINQISPEFEQLKRIFPAIRRGRVNPAVIDYASTRHIINAWETNFLNNLWRKRALTAKQAATFGTIRGKILKSVISPARRRS